MDGKKKWIMLILALVWGYYNFIPANAKLIFLGEIPYNLPDYPIWGIVNVESPLIKRAISDNNDLAKRIECLDTDKYKIVAAYKKPIKKIKYVRYSLVGDVLHWDQEEEKYYFYAVKRKIKLPGAHP